MFSNSRIIWLFVIIGAVCSLIIIFDLIFTKKHDDTIDDITDDENDEFVPVEDDFPGNIIQIPGHELLYYSSITLYVYKLTVEDDIESLEEFTSNNRLCKYVQGKIVEVVDDEIVATVYDATLPY